MRFYKGISVGYCLQNDVNDIIQILENMIWENQHVFLDQTGAEANHEIDREK
ncbi:hypothetical protein J21TS7_52160 [Paenibacillus cineris]|uniref:Uncharacterized protein n=1 Tax=Paenibacillus cineris TaxID=237530 RepID=A0ABQ4LK45_9BACL|nr:hypothetical protein J21TS7_52160 [Paenibacillus cineris]